MAEDQNTPTGEDNVLDIGQARQRRRQQRRPTPGDDGIETRDRYLDGLSQRYCLVNDHGTAWIFQEVENELRAGFNNIYRLTARDFKLLYENEPYTIVTEAGKEITKNAAEWWLRSRHHRRQYRTGAEFAPGRKLAKGWYNLWSGWSVQPQKPRASSGCPLFHRFLLDIICAGRTDCFDYVMNWLAAMVQCPDRPGETAIILEGKQGIGKGVLFEYLQKIVGPYALHLRDLQQVHGKYNLHLQNCILLFADEAVYAGDKTVRGILFGIITENRLPIEPKFQNLYQTQNCLHLMMASNNDWTSQVDTDDRRSVIFEVLDTRRNDRKYFAQLAYERDHGGAAALLWELQNRNISQFNPQDIPDTPARRRQVRLGLSSVHQYWLAALDRGFVYRSRYGVRSLENWQPIVSTQLVWQGYMQWCDDMKRSQRDNEVILGKMLTELYGPPVRGPRGVSMPTHEVERLGHRRPGADEGAEPEFGFDEPGGAAGKKKATPMHLADDPQGLVVCKDRPRCYKPSDLAEARDGFDRLKGPLDSPWHHVSDADDDESDPDPAP
jgi:hypothetical protein